VVAADVVAAATEAVDMAEAAAVAATVDAVAAATEAAAMAAAATEVAREDMAVAATVAARAAMEVEDMAATKIPVSYLNERLSHKPAAKPFNPQRVVLSILQH